MQVKKGAKEGIIMLACCVINDVSVTHTTVF
jgi:hypothetical protein